MKRYLAIVGCLLVALVSPSQSLSSQVSVIMIMIEIDADRILNVVNPHQSASFSIVKTGSKARNREARNREARNRGAHKKARKIVTVPSGRTGMDYRKGEGTEEVFYTAVKSHPDAAQFKTTWGFSAFSNSGRGAAIYNRAKKTLRTYDESGGNGMVERSDFIYTKVDDAALLRLVQYLDSLPSHPGSGSLSGFFSDLEQLGCPKQALAKYKHYYPSYYH